MPLASTTSRKGAVELYWLPLGAGGHSVKYNGRVYEWVVARLEGRPRRDLFHAALQVQLPAGPAVVEQAPVPDLHGSERGVVAEGPVGARWLGRFRLFRYEIRVWRGGSIPDIAEAVDSPRLLSNRFDDARRLLDTIRGVPTLTWGRDEIGAGEMWNSNAVIAWSIAKSGLGAETVQPPEGGRAPGWQAGIVAAGDETKPIAEARC